MTQVAFKNCGPFTKCITKIGSVTKHDAVDLDLIMKIFSNLIEYSSDYSETTLSYGFVLKMKQLILIKILLMIIILNLSSIRYYKLLGNNETGNANGILKNATI